MSAPQWNDLLEALALPGSCRLTQRVAKKLLIEHGAATPADKRLITERVEEIRWIAALKPQNVGIPAFRDAEREYLEIAVLVLLTKPADEGKEAGVPSRLFELMHRAIPYPVLLLTQHAQGVHISMAPKRLAQNDAGKVVLEDDVMGVDLSEATSPSLYDSWRSTLALNRQPAVSLLTVYQGWIDCLLSLQAAHRTGRIRLAGNEADTQKRHEALKECETLDREIVRLRNAATRERQMAKRVEQNHTLRKLQARREELLLSL